MKNNKTVGKRSLDKGYVRVSITKRIFEKVTRLEGIHREKDEHKLFASKSHTCKSYEKKLTEKDPHHHFTPKAFPIL